MFKFDPSTMEAMSLRDAQGCLHIAPEARGAIRAMAQKIPETQHALFMIVLDNRPSSETYRSILNVALTPDAAMESMNQLYGEIQKPKVDKPHGFQLAINHERGDELGKLLRNGTTAHQPDRTKDYGELVHVATQEAENPYEVAPEYYRRKGVDYQGSYLLQTALSMPNLSHAAADKLTRVASALPLGVRDAFTVDLARNASGESDVISLTISPNVLSAITHIPLRYHQKTMELNATEFDALADAVGRNGRKRA